MAIERLLVIRLGAMGDLVHAASAVQAVKRQYPSVQVDWLTSPAYVELLQAFECDGQPLLANVFAYDKRKGFNGLLETAITLRGNRYDTIINLHTSLKTWLISIYGLLARPGIYAQYRKEKLPVQGEAQRDMPRFHAVEDFLQPFLSVFPNVVTEGLSRQFPPLLAIEPQTPCISPKVSLIIGVGQKRGNRGWPIEHYDKLVKLLLESSGAYISLIGGPEELENAKRLEMSFENNTLAKGRLKNLCGKSSLLETAAVLSQSSVIIGGDTGPLHLASCFDVPIIGIFGPTSIHRTGALGPEAKRIHLLPHEGLSCWPCEQPTCPLPAEQYLACMRETTPETVMAALSKFIPLN